jgi:hypothetical protein
MLTSRQVLVCATLAVVFWGSAALGIRLMPESVGAGPRGDLGFALSIPVSWLCVWLTCRLAKLEAGQILAGCMVVLGGAMLMDGIVLRWFHTVYTADEPTARLGSAWLLWGYGVSAWAALVLAHRRARRDAPAALPRPFAA